MTNLSDYMHSAEAAEYLGIHHNTIRKSAASAKSRCTGTERVDTD